MKRTLLLLSTIILLSCSRNLKQHGRSEVFQRFLGRQKMLEIPFRADICNSDLSKTQSLILDSSDALLFPNESDMSAAVIGLLKDTSKIFAFIIGYPADCMVPDVVIFDKNGNRLQQESLLVDGCGADCGYYRNAAISVYKDRENKLAFHSRDSVFSYTCDSLGKEILGTREHYVKSKSGVIDSGGQLTLKIDSVSYTGN